jgi:hypothetical protein
MLFYQRFSFISVRSRSLPFDVHAADAAASGAQACSQGGFP